MKREIRNLRHVLLLTLIVAFPSTVVHGRQAPICRNTQECRQMALDAAMQGEYERFHDLAWRAVQTGPRNDPALLYLLARAQVLSGRPDDALVMLKRLADMGVPATDAVTDPDFARTRERPGWPAVAEAIARAGTPPPAAPSAPPSPASAKSRPAVPPDVDVSRTPSLPTDLMATSDVGRFSNGQFRAAGLAYDAVSRRFVIGDAQGRKLIVVGVGSEHADDMVRAESAGFDEIATLDIDEKRGDLWVASTTDATGGSALHRLQLVSGRPLSTYRVAPAIGATRLVAFAVQESGGIIALDSAGNRLLSLPRGSSNMTTAVSLKLSGATSVAVAAAGAGSNDIVYVSHDAGIARVELRSGSVAALSTPKGLDLRGFDALRAHGNTLIGLQTTATGVRQLVLLTLNAAGRAVRNATIIDARVANTSGRLSLSISGDDLYYLAADTENAPAALPTGLPPADQFVVRRLTLR